jgi:serine phosphatase RsbU (regulator of sigma subunit)
LHRSIVTGVGSECPLVFAKTKDDRRVPVQLMVAPLRSSSGAIIGGVEVFHDLSATYRDLEKARAIQSISLQHNLPQDVRIGFATHYIPHDIVGGDYYGIRQLNADQYGFLLADVMGHGLAAALYTMYLSALWDRYHRLLTTPSAFAVKMNDELNRIVKRGEAFAAGMCGMVDLHRHEVVFTGAGNPPALWVHANGEFERLNCSGVPFGVMKDAPYGEIRVEVHPGDCLLFFSDGAVEVDNADGKPLGVEGLIAMLKELGYPASEIQVAAIEERVLKYSNSIRLEDDLTFIEIRLGSM